MHTTEDRELEKIGANLEDSDLEEVTTTRLNVSGDLPPKERDVEEAATNIGTPIGQPRKVFIGGREIATFTGHTSSVTSVCLSPDSRIAISGGFDGTLKLWEIPGGRSLGTLKGHTSWVNSVYLSLNNRFALSGSSDDTIKLWEISTEQCLGTFEEDTSEVTSVCLSADNRFALCGTDHNTISLWDVSSGRRLRSFVGHTDDITSICMSADNKLALSGSKDNAIMLWEVATGRCLRVFAGHTWVVNSVCMSADAKFALSGSSDGTLHLWEVETGKRLESFKGHTSWVTSVGLSADGRFAISGSGDGTIKLWEVATGRCVGTLEGHTSWVNCIYLSADSRYAMSGGDDNKLKLWSLDWEFENRQPADWDEGARPYLQNFLTLQTPYAADLPEDRFPSEEEIDRALVRSGSPSWAEKDFQNLLYNLSCAGYGWLRPEGVRQKLTEMAGEIPGVRLLEKEMPPNPSAPLSSSLRSPAISPATKNAAKVILTFISGSIKGREFVFEKRTTRIIGRAKDCNFILPDDKEHRTISRYHCLLDINPPYIRVRDFGSLNGTFANNQRIGSRKELANSAENKPENKPENRECDMFDGDILKIGNISLQVRIEGKSSTMPLDLDSLTLDRGELSGGRVKRSLQNSSANLPAIEGYATLVELGKGKGGEVYLADNIETGEEVALKVMRCSDEAGSPQGIDTFVRQIENTKALQHPHISQIRDYGYENGSFFLTIDYCDSGSIVDLMRRRKKTLSINEAVRIIFQVLDGLEYAHNAEIPYIKQRDGRFSKGTGFIHGCLEPANILLVQSGDRFVAKVGNYGLARAFDLAGLNGLTRTGAKSILPAFMPRHQAIDFYYAKPEIDVWAAAACLYYMLTGTYPRDFKGKDPWLATLQTKAIPIRDRNPSIPKPLAALIDLALSDRPHIHFKTAIEFKKALATIV